MKRILPLGLLVAALFLSGCAMSVPIRPWMFIQNDAPAPMTEPAQSGEPTQTPQDEVFPS